MAGGRCGTRQAACWPARLAWALVAGSPCGFAGGPAQAHGGVAVVVYDAPKMFFSSPELTPTLGPLAALGAPDRPTFGTDPGSRFAWALRELLLQRGLPALQVPGDTSPAPKSTKRIENPRGAPHVIVFTTMNFLGYRPLGWTTYQYGYAAYVRTTDADGNTLGETRCIVKPTQKNPQLQLRREQLQAPGAFEGVVDRATALCAQQLLDDVAASLAGPGTTATADAEPAGPG